MVLPVPIPDWLMPGPPLRPELMVARWYLAGAWALVLGALVYAGAARSRLTQPWRLGLVLVVLMVSTLPGSWTPAYWLGLGFQAPCCLSVLWAGSYLLKAAGGPDWTAGDWRAWRPWSGLAWILGFVLLLDVFACWPGSLYAWGHSALVMGLASSLACLPWVLLGQRRISVLLLTALLLDLVLRLPTGNVFDVWLDPWLWLLLTVKWLLSMWPARTGPRSRSPGQDPLAPEQP